MSKCAAKMIEWKKVENIGNKIDVLKNRVEKNQKQRDQNSIWTKILKNRI